MLLQHTAAFTEMSPTAFISAMASSGGSETDCRDFATKTTTDISTTVTSTQKMLDDVDTGSSCAAMGQDAVTAATAAVTAAKAKLETAKTDKATKQSAKEATCSAMFQVVPLSLAGFKSGLLKKACLDISDMVGFTTADAACTLATTISTTADQAVVTATTKVTDADAALAADVAEASKLKRACLCRVNKEQKAAWAAASTTIASHAADWKQAHEIVCALDKITTCTVPTCPAVTQPALANGVANARCTTTGVTGDGACRSGIVYPMAYQGANFYTSKTKATNCYETCRSYDLAFDAIGSQHTGTAVGDYFCGGAGVVSQGGSPWGTVESSCDSRTPMHRYASSGKPVESTGHTAAAYNNGVCWIHCACK